jgi:multicomponent Na+:H+ antiporter subunit F
MTEILLQAGLFLCAAGMTGGFIRLLRGPDLADRVLALDAITVQAVVLFAGLALLQRRVELLAPMVVIALVGFVATVTLCRLIRRP